MRKLICTKCWKIWYAPDVMNSALVSCKHCGGSLKEVANRVIKEDEENNKIEPL